MPTPPPEPLRDRLWLWCHEAGAHNGLFGVPGRSAIAPAEALAAMGIPNAIVVRYGEAFRPEAEAAALAGARRVVWSIVGAGGATEGDEVGKALELAARHPNITGVIMDDFFAEPSSGQAAVHDPASLGAIRERLASGPRALPLHVVLYDHQLHLPVQEHLALCDVVTFWTWRAENLDRLEENFARAEAMAPRARRLLGCYMWDYGAARPMPLDAMVHQVELGNRFLAEGRVDGLIFLASCICDLDLEAVHWTRRWIASLPEG